jgi:hypothetical protein
MFERLECFRLKDRIHYVEMSGLASFIAGFNFILELSSILGLRMF